MSNHINIAIDGPVASGKGTVAKELSKRLKIPTLNTGALYRGVTAALKQNGIDINDEKSVLLALPQINMRVFVAGGETRILLNDKDRTNEIFKNAISRLVPIVSAYTDVRNFVNGKINEIASQGDFIMEGRDIGTTVLPSAKYKFFLTAGVEERAKRRMTELISKGETVSYANMLLQVKERDAADTSRKNSPLRQAPDAVLIDGTEMTVSQIVDRMVAVIKHKN
jgi:cytidylate kinase